ncbi:class I SAM-dependent DNA methyltransferase [Tessaracoccus sp. MC1627]|uniref:class I SAM-dependent DNA methyltransferase n=1 Tax=Tessaracoccus sp. MC1627 TaxID=2760312 RepID=UPI001C725B8D|nr:class I SAM-dependent DNA methyltransferase [Tessaracoccus sp. MC1627]
MFYALALVNSKFGSDFADLLNPTHHFKAGDFARLPLPIMDRVQIENLAVRAIEIARLDWLSQETAPGFFSPLVEPIRGPVSVWVAKHRETGESLTTELREIEQTIQDEVGKALGEDGGESTPVLRASITLFGNAEYQHGSSNDPDGDAMRDTLIDLVSYAVGCMFGRYSVDESGLILGDQGATVRDYLAKVPNPSFAPDKDNVIPIVDSDWFEDDIVARFRTFLRVAFGEQHFEENLRFVTESLGVRDIRDYFVKSFYKDHVQRYKKRPIYWLFSSPKGSFNALIYLHRYTPSTVSTVLNEYLREFTAKLTSSLHQQERLAVGGGTPRQQAAAQKESDRLRKVLLELEEYEHDVLYPLASRQLAIDLDDGVKANYPKFGAALKKIPGLEASDE